ncbi:MAG: DUF1330 domain-containing protein [Rhodospirillaceae bacterium]|nr:DUF1330 domain-containing protein [Rhodospirillaceae bacterium]
MPRSIALLAALIWAAPAAAQPVCTTGAAKIDMVIHSVVHDVERYTAYRQALADSKLIAAFGGVVRAVGTRLSSAPEMLEGDWPANRHAFVIRWPCAAAAKAFWNSDTYQHDILPLRRGAGSFDVALYPAVE